MTVYLRSIAHNHWAIFNDNRKISPDFSGPKYKAIEEARAWVSSWGWSLVIEDE